jgi:dTDP-4-dehydrorhamnose reductase
MRVVITGAKGQLGRQLVAAFAGNDILEIDFPDDITRPAARELVADHRPDLVVHAAAYTDVDGCEKDPDLAFRVNALGTQNVALGAQQAGASLLHISTNEVFDGARREPYREWDQVNPTSVYARSKAAAEQIVRDTMAGRFYIVRIAWLFGPGGVNFVTKILAAAAKNGGLRVAADEFGNPTYAPDLAAAVARLSLRHLSSDQRGLLLPFRVRAGDHAADGQGRPAGGTDPERRLAAAVSPASACAHGQHERRRPGPGAAPLAGGVGGVPWNVGTLERWSVLTLERVNV